MPASDSKIKNIKIDKMIKDVGINFIKSKNFSSVVSGVKVEDMFFQIQIDLIEQSVKKFRG
ncbi:16572_t:CDS:2 [Dentiscutata heterogama]|uniref:16572_t:CDS:1 n=1 Tax=Dentiscutata heterogama TaxID=1316150 RepID=A0ACA9K9G1_9GLOM|nr:16572_t:CDS:2 [Dentiscutata heterogama]